MSVDVVKQMFEAFGEGNLPRMLELVSEDVQWDHRGPPGPPLNKLFHGKDGVAEFFKILGDTEEALKFDVGEFFESGNKVVVLGRYRFRVFETGKEWESDYAMIYTVEGGLVKGWKTIHDMTAEVEAYRA